MMNKHSHRQITIFIYFFLHDCATLLRLFKQCFFYAVTFTQLK